MSAWLCSNNHINLLAETIKDLNISDKSIEQIGAILYAENVRSLKTRYTNTKDLVYYHKFERIEQKKYNYFQIMKQCDCYNYQSCETSDYHETVSGEWLKDIRDLLINREDEYNNAPWGID